MDALRGLFLFVDVRAEYRVEAVAGVFLLAGVCPLYLLYYMGGCRILHEDHGAGAHEIRLYHDIGSLVHSNSYREIDGHVYARIRLINPMNRER